MEGREREGPQLTVEPEPLRALLRYCCQYISLQCFDTVGLATGRAFGLYKVGCWFAGGDDLTAALHVL